jgi:hypothetical protein
MTALGGALAVIMSTNAFAQRNADAAFTAAGESCEQVTWSDEALERYPNIETACQEVMERDGEYFVRFEGEVRRVADRGERVTIAFEGGDTLTLTPPENLSLTIDGRSRTPRDLRPGDELTFYVPEDQLTATFFAGQPETSEPQDVPISPTTDSAEDVLAQADDTEADQPRLPRTAGFLPFVGAGGLALLGLGGLLTLSRRLGHWIKR